MKIYKDILYAIQSETKSRHIVPTRIQQKTNVPFDRLKTYLSELRELGLIQDESSPKLTEKGQKYITEYDEVLNFMKRMGLAYRKKYETRCGK
jgi:predicted transcriptional regulator